MSKKITVVTVLWVLSLGGTTAWGVDWIEDGDAGPLPDSAQTVLGPPESMLTGIVGSLDGGADLQDFYVIEILDPDAFLASTNVLVGNGTADFDTELFLFDTNRLRARRQR